MKKIVIKVILGIAVTLAALIALDGIVNKFSFLKGAFKHELSIDKTANVITRIKKISEFTTACYYEEFVLQRDKYDYKERKVHNASSSAENPDAIKASAGSAWEKVKDATGKAVNEVKDNTDTTAKGKLSSLARAAKDAAKASGSAVAEMASSAAPELVNLAKKDDIVVDSTKVGTIVFIVKSKVRAGFDLSQLGEEDVVVKGDTLSIKLPEAEIFDIIVNPSDWEIYHREGDWEDAEIRDIQSKAKDAIREDAVSYGLLEKAESCGKDELISLFKTFGFSNVVIVE